MVFRGVDLSCPAESTREGAVKTAAKRAVYRRFVDETGLNEEGLIGGFVCKRGFHAEVGNANPYIYHLHWVCVAIDE
jgi:hypothetical protein